ncbi:MAG: hypothetical protein ABIK64_00450, partial [Bacillota bacterium]
QYKLGSATGPFYTTIIPPTKISGPLWTLPDMLSGGTVLAQNSGFHISSSSFIPSFVFHVSIT